MLRRVDDESAAGEALAPVVVRVTLERERDPARDERAERLARRAREVDPDRVVGQPLGAPAARDLVAEQGADRAVHVPDRQGERDGLLLLDRVPAARDDRGPVEGTLEAVVLARDTVARDLRRHVRLV